MHADDVDSEGGHAHDAGEAVDEAEESLAREGRERKEERDKARLGGEERNQAAGFPRGAGASQLAKLYCGPHADGAETRP